MSDIRTPREVFASLSSGISSGDWGRLHELYAPDTKVEIPFAPARIDGREQVREHFARNGQSGLSLRAHDVVVHETADPEVIVAEYAYTVEAGGKRFEAANIQVLRVRDGLIVESRDFHDHAKLAAALS